MSACVYLCCISLLAAGLPGVASETESIDDLQHHMDKKASSMRYIGLGKRTIPDGLSEYNPGHPDDTAIEKRSGDAYRYASLGKRETGELYRHLAGGKRSGAFKYSSLGKRDGPITQETGPELMAKRAPSGFKYSSLGKRDHNAVRYGGLNKQDSSQFGYDGLDKKDNSAFRYSSLGKRSGPSLQMVPESSGNVYHSLGKRSANLHDIHAKRLGFAYKYASVGKRDSMDMDKKWYSSPPRLELRPLQRRAAANIRFMGVGKRADNPGIKYASLGKRQSQWKYAGLGKRALSEERLEELLERLLEQQENALEQPRDQSYSDQGSFPVWGDDLAETEWSGY